MSETPPPSVGFSRGVYCDRYDSRRSTPLPSPDRDRALLVKLMLANIDRIYEFFLNRDGYLTDEEIARREEAKRRRQIKILMSMRFHLNSTLTKEM